MIIGFFYITLQGKLLLFFLFSIMLILFTYVFYRYTIPTITFYKKLVLSLLRIIVLILLVLLIFEPILSIVSIVKEKPKIGILIDNTNSMMVSKNSNKHIQKLKEFLDSERLQEKYPDVSFEYYSFKEDVVMYNQFIFDSLKFDGELTNISSALTAIKNKNYNSIVLITDGNYNSGGNPIYKVEELGVPIFVIGVGDTMQQKDVMISKVQTNNIAYAGSKVPVEVTLNWFGFNKENAELTLIEDRNIISRTVIELNEGEFEKRISLNYDANNIGVRKLNVRITNFSDELTEKNNYKDFFIEVLKSKLKIVIIAGEPSPDVSVTYNTLIENDNFDVMSFIQKNAEEFYPFYRNGKYELKFNENILDTIDCLVLINYPTQVTKISDLNKILSKIQEKKIPVLLILGKNVDYSKLQYLSPFLPFGWQSYNSKEILVFPELNENLAGSILINKELTKDKYQQLPPIYKLTMQYQSRAESNVIAYVKAQDLKLNEPLFISRNINRHKTFAILGYGIWRWKLLTYGPDNEKFLYNFLTTVVGWLTILEDKQKIRITPVKQNFTTLDPIEFTAEIYNDQYQPIDNAIVKINVSSNELNYEMLMKNIGNGRYEVSMNNLISGDYTYSAKIEVNGTSIGEMKGKFSVGNINLEYLDTKMNIYLLKKIGFQSGGMYLDADSINTLINAISSVSLETVQREVVKEFKLWTAEIIGGFVVMIFIVEWFIRKKSGLL